MERSALDAGSRHHLLRELDDARRSTDRIFAMLAPRALRQRPIPERHRVVFYLGHVEAFDWNLVGRGAFGHPAAEPELDRLFAFGIDPVDGGLPVEPESFWPPTEQVRVYGARRRDVLDGLLAGPWPPGLMDGELLHAAIEHRHMHAETLAYMLHAIPGALKRGPAPPPRQERGRVVPRAVDVPAGRTTLGAGPDAPFAWDNELRPFVVEVPALSIDEYPVTNGQYLDFVRAGGYDARELWDDDGWSWVTARGIRHPEYWTSRDDAWCWRGAFDEVPLPLDGPVYVSHAEATAFARFAGKRLPTEAEWHRAWGDAPAPPSPAGAWDPVAVSAGGRSALGVADLFGNGWEWTSTTFGPLPGFAPRPYYPGYSADFFDGRHFVLKGASPRTAPRLRRPSFRNWFQPHYPHPFAKFRCVAP